MLKRLMILTLLAGASVLCRGQNPDQTGHQKGNDEHHEHHSHEVGIANSAVFFFKEKSLSYGIHMHYTYTLPGTKFGIGGGYERIFDEHKHNTIGIHAIYQPLEGFHLNLSPGIAFEGEEKTGVFFALHLETSYEFLIHDFHIGPSLEIAYEPEDYHLSFGIHIGYGF